MNCSICGNPVVLVPSAAERARKSGGTAEFYTQLFPTHAACHVRKRNQMTSELIKNASNIHKP